MNVKEMLRMPWSFQGPVKVVDDGVEHWELRIDELPGFFLAGESRDEVMNDLRPALQAFLESYLDHGEQPPLPVDLSHWRMKLVNQRPGAYVPVKTLNPPGEGITGGGALLATVEA